MGGKPNAQKVAGRAPPREADFREGAVNQERSTGNANSVKRLGPPNELRTPPLEPCYYRVMVYTIVFFFCSVTSGAGDRLRKQGCRGGGVYCTLFPLLQSESVSEH